VTVHVDQRTARECYVASLRLTPTKTMVKKDVNQRMVALTDLDPRVNDEVRMKPSNNVTKWQLARANQNTRLGGSMMEDKVEKMKEILVNNRDLFAWTAEDMSGIVPRVMSQKLSICKEARPIALKKRRVGEEKRIVAATKVQKLLDAGFIKEIQYITWLVNVVLVKKSNGQWRMCVDYTDLDKACPKDAYPLSNIDRLVDGAADNRVLSFLVERTEGFCEDNWGRIDLVFSLSNEVDDFLIIVLSFRENHQSIDSIGRQRV